MAAFPCVMRDGRWVAACFLSWLGVLLMGAGVASGAEPKADPHGLIIHPLKLEEWHASAPDIEKVLASAAEELWKNFPERTLPAIDVEPQGGPVTNFRRAEDGAYHVQLNTGGTFWSQYAYQFAHEFCHILCNYRQGPRNNKWFEESLCELASIYALRGMARTWQTHPPYPNWKDYSKSLNSYADDLLKQGQLPAGLTLAQWFAQQREELAKDPVQREKNRVVAVALLDLFETAPEHWEAVGYLNQGDTGWARSFAVYLADWEAQCPQRHKAFVRQIAQRLGIKNST